MGNICSKHLRFFCGAFFLTIMTLASCKKDNNNNTNPTPVAKPLATIGLYEIDSSVYKRVFIAISKIGTKNVSYYGIFDTGSTGMTIDATGLIPASMITSTGITVPGDSVTVNGITVKNEQAVITYGNSQSQTQEYGNLAYTTVTIGDQNGNFTTSRIPIFLYYKIVDGDGTVEPAHSNDVFGVGPGVSYANSAIGSPLSYLKTGTGLTSGYKLAKFINADFTVHATYAANLLTIGLVPDDLAVNGFILHPLTFYSQGGYSPDIASTITYNGTSVAGTILFDTGTPAISTIANQNASGNISSLRLIPV